MKKLLPLALLLFASVATRAQTAASQAPGQVTPGPGNDAGLLYASSFGQWSVPQGNTGQFSWSSPTFCTVPADGIPLSPVFAVGTPVLIRDQSPVNTETVSPTAVSVGGAGCSITVTPAHQHKSFVLQSGTAGLQEAINYAHGLSYEIVLTPDWTRIGGTSAMIAAAKGNSNVSIVDERTSCFIAYQWSGSTYAQAANLCSGSGGGTAVKINHGGFLATLDLNADTPAPDANYLALLPKIAGSSAIIEAPYATTGQYGVTVLASGGANPYLGYAPANCTAGTTGNDCLQLSSGTFSPALIAVGALTNGMTGTTQTVGDNTNKLATDAFVIANAGGGGGGPSPSVVTTTNPAVRYGSATGYDAIPSVTPWCDIRAHGAAIDGSTDIGAAVQACSNLLNSLAGGTGTILLPCGISSSSGGVAGGCYWSNPSALTERAYGGSIKILLQGQLKTGSEALFRSWINYIGGFDGSAQEQFQTGGSIAGIQGPAVNGTLGTAVTTAPSTAVTVTPTFTNGTIANIPPGTAITIADKTSSTATAVRTLPTGYSVGLVTLTTASAIRIPPGANITVSGCTPSTFNTTNNVVSASDYSAQTLTYYQTTTTATTATGCTVTGLNDDAFESVYLQCVNGVPDTTDGFSCPGANTVGSNKITFAANHNYTSSAQWGAVAAGPGFNVSTPQTWSNIDITNCYGACFHAEGSTELVMQNMGAAAGPYITSIAADLQASYLSQFHNVNFVASGVGQVVPPCAGGGCAQPSYPAALRCTTSVYNLVYDYASTCNADDIDQASVLVGGIKIDGQGINPIQGFPRIRSSMYEEPWDHVVIIDNRNGVNAQNCLSLQDFYPQDNVSLAPLDFVGFTDKEAGGGGCVNIENPNITNTPTLVNSYFNGYLIANGVSQGTAYSVPLYNSAPSPTYNEGGMLKGNLPNTGFGPQIVPYGSLPITGFTQALLATACTGFSPACTATSIPGPDGPSGQMTAVQMVSGGNGSGATIATVSKATYAGDILIYGFTGVAPIAGQQFTYGIGNAGTNNSFDLQSAGGDVFAPTNCGTSSGCNTGVAWPFAFGTQLAYDGWEPQVAVAYILTGNSTPHNITFGISGIAQNGLGNQWANPVWTFIAGPNNPACIAAGTCNLTPAQIEAARLQYQGFVPPNSTAGHAVTGEPIDVNNPTLPSELSLTYTLPFVPGSSTTAVLGPNSLGQEVLSEAGGAAARICDATNGVCASPVATIISSGAITVVAQNTYIICTANCTITPLPPALNVQLCVRNGPDTDAVVTLAALGSGKSYELTDHTTWGTANHAVVSPGSAYDESCWIGYSTTQYANWNSSVPWAD